MIYREKNINQKIIIPIEEAYFGHFFGEDSQKISREAKFITLFEHFYKLGYRTFQLIDHSEKRIEIVKEIKSKFNDIFLISGGGISTAAAIEELLSAGSDFVILGSFFASNWQLVNSYLQKYGDRIFVSIDLGNTTNIYNLFKYLALLKSYGCSCYVLVDAGKILSESGVNNDLIREVSLFLDNPKYFIYSGGISSIDDCRTAFQNGADCIIIGSAFYSKKIGLDRYEKVVKDIFE